MKEEEKLTERMEMAEDDQLIDFEFEAFENGDSGEIQLEAQEDEDVIELVDVVEEGEIPLKEEADQMPELIIEGEGVDQEVQAEVAQSKETMNSLEFPELESELEELLPLPSEERTESQDTPDLEGDATQSLELDLEAALEELEPGREAMVPEEPEEEELDLAGQGDSLFELEELGEEGIPEEEEGKVAEGLEPEAREAGGSEIKEPEPVAAGGELEPQEGRKFEPPIHIDEERLEQLITETVERVVERVARQTMAEVAERVITEAIDALKESLEETSS